MRPLDGAREFLDWLRGTCQVVILSDTYYEFAAPLMRQLGYPTLFCHELVVDDAGRVRDYRLRMPDQKRAAVKRSARSTSTPSPPAIRTTTPPCSPRRTPASCSARPPT